MLHQTSWRSDKRTDPAPSPREIHICVTQASENVPLDMCALEDLNQPTHHAVLLKSSLSAWRNFAFLAVQNAPSEESDHTAPLRRLIWIFAGSKYPKVRFLTLRDIFCNCQHVQAIYRPSRVRNKEKCLNINACVLVQIGINLQITEF